jgi:hypothetical protein
MKMPQNHFKRKIWGSGIRKNSDCFRLSLQSCDFSYGFDRPTVLLNDHMREILLRFG